MDFYLVISGTELIKYPGISAAGASPELLAYTAALDAEYLCLGQTLTLSELPRSPAGIISPALISRRCLELLELRPHIINAGAHIKPILDESWLTDLNTKAARSPETGSAINLDEVKRLFAYGRAAKHPKPVEEKLHRAKHNFAKNLIIAECVVAGTTTAQALLKALGYEVSQMLSSSLPKANHKLKQEIIESAYQALLRREPDFPEQVKKQPLLAVSAMGDPMQALVAGMAISCLEQGYKCILAGGSQMIAVAALIEKLCPLNPIDLEVSTSHWVMQDPDAQIEKLFELCCKRSQLSWSHEVPKVLGDLDLAAYDQGHVKEGVGAGALMKLIGDLTTKNGAGERI